MRVLIATGLYPPDIGGPATYSKLLADKLYLHDVDVSVLPFAKVRYLPKIIRHVMYFFLLLKNGRAVDVIYAQDPVSVGFPAAFAAIALRKRFFLKIVGDRAWEIAVQSYAVHDDLDTFSRKHAYVPQIIFYKYVQRFVCGRAERIIVPSNYLREIVTNWGVTPEKVGVIYNAFTPPVLQEDRVALRRKYNVSGKMLISVGRLVPWKGFEGLITLMTKLLPRYADAHLFIAGDGPLGPKIEKLIQAYHLEGSVHLLGKLPQKELFEYIAAADVFVLNTAYEGLSHQLLEVMAIGIPIVTTPAGGNKEVITHGTNGYLVFHDDIDAYLGIVSHLFDHPDEANAVTARAREGLSRFREDRMLTETAALLKNLSTI